MSTTGYNTNFKHLELYSPEFVCSKMTEDFKSGQFDRTTVRKMV